jgi:hypothetical protein
MVEIDVLPPLGNKLHKSMSRSKRHTPKRGITTSETEKGNKRMANRKLRRKTKVQVKKGDSELSRLREVSNVWAFDKDGKLYLLNPTRKDLRK